MRGNALTVRNIQSGRHSVEKFVSGLNCSFWYTAYRLIIKQKSYVREHMFSADSEHILNT